MAVRLSTIEGNRQRLDGGAMFGNAPRALWQRWATPDEANTIPLACRCLLIETDDARILCETGIGLCFPPELRARYGVTDTEDELAKGLAALGLTPDDIDVVVLSHLHFDHAGGLLHPHQPDAPPRLRFDRAEIVVSEAALARAKAPHPRDRASFLPYLPDLLEGSGRLRPFAGTHSDVLGDGYRFHLSDGHTPGLALLELSTDAGPVVYAADLIPGAPWVHVPITMGYDRFPERVVDEKQILLADLLERNGSLVFTHDPEVAIATVGFDGRKYLATNPRPSLTREPA